MNLNDFTPEQIERAKACKTPEELHDLASEYGIELTDEMLDGVAGGEWCKTFTFAPPCSGKMF